MLAQAGRGGPGAAKGQGSTAGASTCQRPVFSWTSDAEAQPNSPLRPSGKSIRSACCGPRFGRRASSTDRQTWPSDCCRVRHSPRSESSCESGPASSSGDVPLVTGSRKGASAGVGAPIVAARSVLRVRCSAEEQRTDRRRRLSRVESGGK
eukprot:scaffold12441_cov90-Isochrysis_galbana.AAC.1